MRTPDPGLANHAPLITPATLDRVRSAGGKLSPEETLRPGECTEREPLLSGGLKSKFFKPESVRGLVFPHVEKTSNKQEDEADTQNLSRGE